MVSICCAPSVGRHCLEPLERIPNPQSDLRGAVILLCPFHRLGKWAQGLVSRGVDPASRVLFNHRPPTSQSTWAGVALLSLSLLLCPQVEKGRGWNGMCLLPVIGAVPVLGCCCRSVPGDAALWRCGCSLLPPQGWQTLALIYV